jgi:hypothetical protein
VECHEILEAYYKIIPAAEEYEMILLIGIQRNQIGNVSCWLKIHQQQTELFLQD